MSHISHFLEYTLERFFPEIQETYQDHFNQDSHALLNTYILKFGRTFSILKKRWPFWRFSLTVWSLTSLGDHEQHYSFNSTSNLGNKKSYSDPILSSSTEFQCENCWAQNVNIFVPECVEVWRNLVNAAPFLGSSARCGLQCTKWI